MESSDVELDLQRSVQAVLRELSAQAPALRSNQGMWRWSLHKKVERDPGKSPALVRILLRELEKAEREDTRRVIIPLLHTLMYVLTKATGISQELYRRTYALCVRFLTLPAPYCTVALDCAIRLKTESAAPDIPAPAVGRGLGSEAGSLLKCSPWQGRCTKGLVIAEQNLRSELYPYQERVFLFVDPELVSPSVCSALLLEIQAAQTQQTPEACMRHVVSHALQAALGGACRADALQRKLQASPRRALERHFHAVVAAVEQMASEPSATREGHLDRLEEIYCSLLGPTAAARGRCGGDPLPAQPASIPLPSPHITFQLWTDEEQLWKELVLFLRLGSQGASARTWRPWTCRASCPTASWPAMSVLSTDSGIERDLPSGADELPAPSSPETERARAAAQRGREEAHVAPDISRWDGPPGLHRRTGRPGEDGELLPGVARLHTARVLVLGDDRMLGRLARAYHSLRKRETQTFCLSPRLSLQLYYIPVLTPEKRASSRHLELGELAAFLGRADPWYESTVNTLCPAIQKLAEMPPSLDTSQTVDPFILDVITYYVRMGTQPIYFQLYTVKIFFGDLSQDSAEDIFLTELKVKIQDSKLPKDGFSPRRRGAAEAPGAELSLSYQKVSGGCGQEVRLDGSRCQEHGEGKQSQRCLLPFSGHCPVSQLPESSALLSHRTREVTISLRATGLVLKALPASDTEDHTCLSVNVTEVVKSSNLAGRSFSVNNFVCNPTWNWGVQDLENSTHRLPVIWERSGHVIAWQTVTNTFRAANVQIQSQDQRLLTLWLDKDNRRTFRDVVRFEVAPCPEPCSGVQKSKALWLSSHQQKEMERTKAKPKPLLMPINTFSGVVQCTVPQGGATSGREAGHRGAGAAVDQVTRAQSEAGGGVRSHLGREPPSPARAAPRSSPSAAWVRRRQAAMSANPQWDIRRALGVAGLFHLVCGARDASVTPFLTLYLRQLGLAAPWVGILMGSKHLTAAFWAPFCALLAHSHRRRRVLLPGSLLGSVGASLLVLLVPPLDGDLGRRSCHAGPQRDPRSPASGGGAGCELHPGLQGARLRPPSPEECWGQPRLRLRKRTRGRCPSASQSPAQKLCGPRGRSLDHIRSPPSCLGNSGTLGLSVEGLRRTFIPCLASLVFWELLAAPLEQVADDSLFEYLDFVDATDRHGNLWVWKLLGTSAGVCGIAALVERLDCSLKTGGPGGRRREPSYKTSKALSLVEGDPRLILLAVTVFLTGAVTSTIQNFLFWHMQDQGSSELVMGVSVALGLLGEILLHPFRATLLRKLSRPGTIGLGLGCLAGQLLYYSFLWSWWSVLPVQALSALSSGALWWAVGASIEDLATPGTERPLSAMFRGHFYGGGASLGSFVGGFVVRRFSLPGLYQASCAVLGLWLAFFLSVQPRLPQEQKVSYSKLLVVEASDTSDSEQGTERDWLVKASLGRSQRTGQSSAC
ncbi:hypothetical protein QTO34_009641 [Cnephaeus nilssonii]|uniref:Major facilitator superfamily associated domain-containing protein n=1 Tax=Cnephaeus nilssonii TaxID=3371016 RepID=A0AA40HI60_CNENI|nr:hypothetical protein QTO34_009641 [Eptesicus nilssonii]